MYDGKLDINTPQGRVEFMYAKTLGADSDAKARLDEFKEIWKLQDSAQIPLPVLPVLICLTNVVMAKKDSRYTTNPFSFKEAQRIFKFS